VRRCVMGYGKAGCGSKMKGTKKKAGTKKKGGK
jgi:hypothetical protein